jgi:hypothetical protein
MPSRLIRTERKTAWGSTYHVYALDGARIPGATTVLNKAIAKNALNYWYGRQAAQWAATNVDSLQLLGESDWIKQAAGAADRAKDSAANVGTQLHEHAKALVEGRATHPPAELADRVRHMADFLDTHDVHEVASEASVYHEAFRYAGTLDLVAEVDGTTWLLDWKTGKGVYPEVALQLAAYRYATHLVAEGIEMRMPPVERCGVLWIRESGWELIPVRADEDSWQVFIDCLSVYGFASRDAEYYVMPPVAAGKYIERNTHLSVVDGGGGQ